MTTRQISETIEDIYGFEVSDGMVSDITDRLLPQIEEWQNRPLDEVYPVVFIDAVHFSVRDNGQIKKLAAYVILAVSLTGHKEVLSIHIGENESAKYWLGVLNELKNRGVKDILVICTNGLSGMKEAVAAAYPQTELQRCIVHQVRNTLKYVANKDMKAFAKHYGFKSDAFFLGRAIDYAVAMEGALKLKEISYIHAEAYAGGELKHGTLALIEEGVPVIALATQEDVYDKMISNIREVKAREAVVIGIGMKGDEELSKHVDHTIYVPRANKFIAPILAVVPLQLLAYYAAITRGADVDKPRNLAKSVTVE